MGGGQQPTTQTNKHAATSGQANFCHRCISPPIRVGSLYKFIPKYGYKLFFQRPGN